MNKIAGDQVEMGFSFASDYLSEWHELSGTINKRNKVKPIEYRIALDNQSKITLQRTYRYSLVHQNHPRSHFPHHISMNEGCNVHLNKRTALRCMCVLWNE